MPRSALPLAIKVARGTLKNERVNPGQPVLAEGAPPVPKDLAPDERAAWDRLVDDLTTMHVLTPQDGAALEMLAVTYARWRRLVSVLRRDGHTYKYGTVLRHRPEVVMERRAFQQWCSLAGRFGLTPSDRQHVRVIPNPKRDQGTLAEFRGSRDGLSEFSTARR